MTESLAQHPSIKAYSQHGFIPFGETDEEIFGECAFCHHKKVFYVNKESKAWSCKTCGKEGGFLSFLEDMAEECSKNFSGEPAIKLAKSRGISLKTLRKFNLGYNKFTRSYCFPVYRAEGSRIHDLRIFRNGKLISTKGCKTGLLGSATLAQTSSMVYLCEGEWDTMVMQEILDKAKIENTIAVGVPGAGTFKAEWIPLFTDKAVHVVYDNDDPGQKGALKVYNFLNQQAKKISFVNWDDTFENNFDLRDLYQSFKKDAVKTLKKVLSMLGDYPMMIDLSKLDEEKKGPAHEGSGIPAAEVYKMYTKWLHIPDTSVIDILFGTIIANRLPGVPVWMFLVAPPGMTKTSLLQTVADSPEVTSVSTLTPHSLISGSNAGGVDPSLIPKLNGRILSIKDFTTILNMNQQAREEIFGTLRDAYDGEIVKTFGHGITRSYRSKFAIIAAVTPAIETFLENESALGERFLRWSMQVPNSVDEHLEYMKRATGNISRKDEMLDEMRTIGQRVLDYDFSRQVEVPDHIHEKVLYLAMWTAKMRGTIIRDRFTKEVLYKPFEELGTRLSEQFMKLMMGISLFRRVNKVTISEFNIIKKLARGTVPSRLEDAVHKIHKHFSKEPFTVKELSELIRLPEGTVKQIVNSLFMLGVLKKEELSGLKTTWGFNGDYLRIVKKSGIY